MRWAYIAEPLFGLSMLELNDLASIAVLIWGNVS